MAVFFDVVYRSEEKDRVPSALNNGILTNVLPFLKSHSLSNANHYAAASQILAALSSYQFTRRAWRREVFELFIDSAFFQASAPALHSWRGIIDNLVTQEKNTFKEALSTLRTSSLLAQRSPPPLVIPFYFCVCVSRSTPHGVAGPGLEPLLEQGGRVRAAGGAPQEDQLHRLR